MCFRYFRGYNPGGAEVLEEMTKVLFYSDIHVSHRNADYMRFLEVTIQHLEEMVRIHAPDFLVNLGDTLDTFGIMDVRDGAKAQEYLSRLSQASPSGIPHIVLRGNHDCISIDTEVLCDTGWVGAKDVSAKHRIASYDLTSGVIDFYSPLSLSSYEAPCYNVEGCLSSELISDGHKIDIRGILTPVTSTKAKIRQTEFRYCGFGNQTGIDMSLNDIKLITWLIMDGTWNRHVNEDGTRSLKTRIQWKLSNPRKIETLRNLLEDLRIDYTFREATKSPTNILTPFYICVYGDKARKMWDYLGGIKEFPDSWVQARKNELDAILESLLETDACRSRNQIDWSTTSVKNRDVIQIACIRNGVPCKWTKRGKSGFGSGKSQYHVYIYDRGVPAKKFVTVSPSIFGPVVAITMPKGTLITRRNGKVSFTGNSADNRGELSSTGIIAPPEVTYVSKPMLLQFPGAPFLCIPHTKDVEAANRFIYDNEKNAVAIFAHMDFLGCRLTPAYVSKEGLDPAILAKCQLPVFAGHYHAPMEVGCVNFVGSPLYHDFRDLVVDESRGFLLWEYEPMAAAHSSVTRRIANPYTYRCIRIEAKTKKALQKACDENLPEAEKLRVKVYVPKKLIEDAQDLFRGFLWSGVYPIEGEKEGIEFAAKVNLRTTPEEAVKKAAQSAGEEFDKATLEAYGIEAFRGAQ